MPPPRAASGWRPAEPPRRPVLFVNPLGHPLFPGTRPSLGTGQLGVVVLGPSGEGRLPPGRAWTAPRLEVSAPAALHAGVDGEAADLSPLLRFGIRPGALRIRISSRHPGASPSARFHPR